MSHVRSHSTDSTHMNLQLSLALKEVRKTLGYSSARAFHAWLSSKADLGINYSYYMRIEGGRVLPSSLAIQTIAALLPATEGDRLVLAWCRDSFPNRARLFESPVRQTQTERRRKSSEALTRIRQRTLTEKQVAALARSKSHYFLFLLVTLARSPVSLEEIREKFPDLPALLRDLKEAKVLAAENGAVSSAFPEWAFPPAETRSLEAHYRALDSFDRERNRFFDMTKVKTAELFRRISPRYLDLVIQNLDLLLQTVRLAEDVNHIHNEEVIGLSVEISRGKIPG